MKIVRTLLTITAALFFANAAFATGDLRVDILPLNAERAVVAISNTVESKYNISILNSSGDVIYFNETEEQIADYRKIFDFSQLDPDNYKLLVNIDGATSERSFSLGDKNIKVGGMKSIVDPFFSYKDGILRLSYLNYPGKAVNIRIYDKDGLIYEKALGDEFSISRGFVFSKLKSGNYDVILETADQNYDYSVSIR